MAAVMQPAHTPTVSLIRAADDDIAVLSALASDPAVAPFLAVGSGDEPALRTLLSETTEDRGPDGLFVIRPLAPASREPKPCASGSTSEERLRI